MAKSISEGNITMVSSTEGLTCLQPEANPKAESLSQPNADGRESPCSQESIELGPGDGPKRKMANSMHRPNHKKTVLGDDHPTGDERRHP